MDIGDPQFECQLCGAAMWLQEKNQKNTKTKNPNFYLCCGVGKIQLPLLKRALNFLQRLLYDQDSNESKNYHKHIHSYNMMFSFTSPEAKFDNSLNNGRLPPSFRRQGQFCHLIGSLLPLLGQAFTFTRLYIYDTKNEIQNHVGRLGLFSYIIV